MKRKPKPIKQVLLLFMTFLLLILGACGNETESKEKDKEENVETAEKVEEKEEQETEEVENKSEEVDETSEVEAETVSNEESKDESSESSYVNTHDAYRILSEVYKDSYDVEYDEEYNIFILESNNIQESDAQANFVNAYGLEEGELADIWVGIREAFASISSQKLSDVEDFTIILKAGGDEVDLKVSNGEIIFDFAEEMRKPGFPNRGATLEEIKEFQKGDVFE